MYIYELKAKNTDIWFTRAVIKAGARDDICDC